MEDRINPEVPPIFDKFFPRLQEFLNDTLYNEEVDDDLYVEGSTRIEYFASLLRQENELYIEEHKPPGNLSRTHDFEETLFERLLETRNFNLLVLLGGLGVGKSTTVKYLLRRFDDRHDKLKENVNCSYSNCFRKPTYIDFRSLAKTKAKSKEEVVTEVFRKMRLAIYEKLIKEWLKRNRNNVSKIREIDPKFLTLRRLLIANDFFNFQGGDYLGLSDLYNAELKFDGSLISNSMSDKEIIDLINNYQEKAVKYGMNLENIVKDQGYNQDFMVLTLNFFLHMCNPENPSNLIVLDNLDQLPTDHLEELLQQLHDLATRTRFLPILVPLRASSINPYGFIRDILFRYHYGPNNFLMVLSRLERHILTQSRDELRIPRTEGGNKPFPTPPSDEEIDALLVICYLYANIMLVGLGAPQKTISIHKDHNFLYRINIGQGTLRGLAETSDALVGYCCRYGLDLLRRFIQNAYGNDTVLRRAIRVRATANTTTHIRFGYATLVSNLLRDPIGGAQSTRVANLFQPTQFKSNPGWPTLTKLRILSLLVHEKRLDVKSIVQKLNLLGIPSELALEALNYLQNKFRLLLWLSTNRPLKISDPSSLLQDVVISEHGERYFRRVVGDFEYIWYCATSLMDRKYYHGGKLMLTVKLNDYKGMIQRIGTTEWKQIGFNRMHSESLEDVSGIGHATKMEVLNVLYSSLGRALLGAVIAMDVHSETNSLIKKLLPLVTAICEQIIFWQKRYEIAYGSNFYLSVYKDQISDLQNDILGLRNHKAIGIKKLSESFNTVETTWLKDVESHDSMNIGHLPEMPKEDLVTLVSKYGRGMLIGAQDWVKTIDKVKAIKVHSVRFLKTRGELTKLLESRLPTYSEVLRYTQYLLQDIERIISNGTELAATGELVLSWCTDERSNLQQIHDELKENSYEVPEICNMEDMSKLKNRYNNIISTTERLARHLGVADTSHLSEKWQ